MKTAEELRREFLDYFSTHEHRIVPSESLLPGSPNLLFTNAGMNQFVPYFLNERPSPFARAADSQKCIRAGGKHNDLDDVGYDTYHHTFFEMLGNWSFGDYFKHEAISMAWDLLVNRWKFPKERLHVTVYKPKTGEPSEEDREAYGIWEKIFIREGLEPGRHIHFGSARDNFWMMGETGPCGPCTEIHMDLTPDGNGENLVNSGSPRCMELWNLVFIQYNALGEGNFAPLPARYVDTGMGLERIAGVIASTAGFRDFSKNPSNYGSDLFEPLFAAVEAAAGRKITYNGTVPADRKKLSSQEMADCSFRVVADHVRALTFAIGDGILPGNEGRGYVLRRILRRAILFGQRLGLGGNFLADLSAVCIRQMAHAYPTLETNGETIGKVLVREQEAFTRTLERGLQLLQAAIREHDTTVPGDVVFELYDTYGFPVDLAELVAGESSRTLDRDGFEKCMAAQRQRAREAQRAETITVKDSDNAAAQTVFVGHATTGPVETCLIKTVSQGGKFRAVFAETPFYAEKGGQVGDSGHASIDGRTYAITDTQISSDGTILHEMSDAIGAIPCGSRVFLTVDGDRRQRICCHHTATHVLQAALRQVLGNHVKQMGSSVGEDSLRFDFSHFEKLSREQLEQTEDLANAIVLKNFAVRTAEVPFAQRPDHCLAHFGERYGDRVRVVEFVGTQMAELCGGTHVRATGEIGVIKILSEQGIAAGTRRIEAVAGVNAQKLFGKIFRDQCECAQRLHCPMDDLADALSKLQSQKQQLEKQVKAMAKTQAQRQLKEFLEKSVEVNGQRWVTGCFDVPLDNGALRSFAKEASVQLPQAHALLLAREDSGISYVLSTSPESGVSAQKLIETWNAIVGGSGGGNDTVACGKCPAIKDIQTVLQKLYDVSSTRKWNLGISTPIRASL
ncbi:MAG: alanine--tRNA ligase [Puniceicoccales bacterium]|jgi:alanyl-tRNA synthetase|nr:alanine--tRNA ligase [Puniceicoccales bacterium]